MKRKAFRAALPYTIPIVWLSVFGDVLCLLVFGASSFILPAMALIILCFTLLSIAAGTVALSRSPARRSLSLFPHCARIK